MTVHVAFPSRTGKRTTGVLAEPEGESRIGGLLVLHEWWGINQQIEETCERFAEQGFLVLAPDLYHGKRPESSQHASSLAVSLDKQLAMVELGDALSFLRSHPRCNGKIGVTGFCLGGALAFGCACQLEGLAAAVPFYGIPRRGMYEYSTAHVPIQAHFGRHDDWAKCSDAHDVQQAILAAGGQMELFVYETGHAFMRTNDKHVYHADSAMLAWSRAVQFLKVHLSI
jgi:carboxymethylenebutenolidase